jgi:CRISPR-associated protein Cmr5
MTSTTETCPQTLDQRRARHAWEAVREILRKYPGESRDGKQVPHKKAKQYGSHAKKLPVRTVTSGLGQALAFLRAKDYAPELLEDLGDWVLFKRKGSESRQPRPDDKALLNAIVTGNSDDLRRYTDEALAYLQWLTRFAEAEGLTEGDDS